MRGVQITLQRWHVRERADLKVFVDVGVCGYGIRADIISSQNPNLFWMAL